MSHWKYPQKNHTRWLIDFPWFPYHGLELPISITQSPGIFNGSPCRRAASPGPSWVPSSAPCALPLAIADRAPNARRGSGTAGFLGWIPSVHYTTKNLSRVLSFWLTKLAATLRAGVPQNTWFPCFVWMIWGSRFELRGLETSATAHSASFKARSLAAMVAAGQKWEEIWRKKMKKPQSWRILGRFKGCRILATWHDSNYGKIVVANLPICMWQSLWAHCTPNIQHKDNKDLANLAKAPHDFSMKGGMLSFDPNGQSPRTVSSTGHQRMTSDPYPLTQVLTAMLR